MSDKTIKEQIDTLADEIIAMSKNSLIVSMRFMDNAFSKLVIVAEEKIKSTATDGYYFIYNPEYILKLYKADNNGVKRAFLHSVLHCVYQHPFVTDIVHKGYYNLASDIVVENTINEFGISHLYSEKQKKQNEIIHVLRCDVKALTIEKVYQYLLDTGNSKIVKEIDKIFHSDDHFLWWNVFDNEVFENQEDEEYEIYSSENNEETENEDLKKNEAFYFDQSQGKTQSRSGMDDELSMNTMHAFYGDTVELWKNISEYIKDNLKIPIKEIGDTAGSLIQNIEETTRDTYDYTKFLNRFAVLGESIQVNDDEFDYIFYTYGFKLYENMPLIEPLEYKEVKKIREFVIAIDTSGSVSGDVVQAFLNKTYSILSQRESFYEKVNIRIIQCDSEIQTDYKIESLDDFEQYLKDIKFRGFGGTDFRTVFDYVDKLIEEKQFVNLKGLIYFTDGYGKYPEKKPKYESAFILLNEDYNAPTAPTWATKVILTSNDLKQGEKNI